LLDAAVSFFVNSSTQYGAFPVLSIIQAAGWPIWPLLLCSVLSLAFIIERGLNLRRARVAPSGLVDNVLDSALARWSSHSELSALSPEELEPLATSSAMGALLAAGLAEWEKEHQRMSSSVATDAAAFEKRLTLALATRGRELSMDLEKNLSPLATLASASPLLGLLGTVVGMIEIFASQSQASTGPGELGLGISMALYNTAMGLCVAIPSLIFWRFYRSRVERFVMELESAADKIVLVLVNQSKHTPISQRRV
jgi:biopolymer transport protein ExbB